MKNILKFKAKIAKSFSCHALFIVHRGFLRLREGLTLLRNNYFSKTGNYHYQVSESSKTGL